jgi:hypothetical protein
MTSPTAPAAYSWPNATPAAPPAQQGLHPPGQSPTLPKDLVTGIRELEMLYQCVPNDPELGDVKTGLLVRISEMRRALAMSKPIGARLDSSRAFVKRCHDRRDAALSALALAQAAVADTDIALAEGVSFLTALEAEMAPPDPAATATGPDSLESMASSLSRVITEMKNACAIPPELIAETERHMMHLMTGVRTIATSASSYVACPAPPQQVAAVLALAPRPRALVASGRRTKLVGKQRPPALPPTRRRLTVKGGRMPASLIPTQAEQERFQLEQTRLHGAPFILIPSSPESMSDGPTEQGPGRL